MTAFELAAAFVLVGSLGALVAFLLVAFAAGFSVLLVVAAFFLAIIRLHELSAIGLHAIVSNDGYGIVSRNKIASEAMESGAILNESAARKASDFGETAGIDF